MKQWIAACGVFPSLTDRFERQTHRISRLMAGHTSAAVRAERLEKRVPVRVDDAGLVDEPYLTELVRIRQPLRERFAGAGRPPLPTRARRFGKRPRVGIRATLHRQQSRREQRQRYSSQTLVPDHRTPQPRSRIYVYCNTRIPVRTESTSTRRNFNEVPRFFSGRERWRRTDAGAAVHPMEYAHAGSDNRADSKDGHRGARLQAARQLHDERCSEVLRERQHTPGGPDP